jgi:tripartite ATP-independent transporter DctM subunit
MSDLEIGIGAIVLMIVLIQTGIHVAVVLMLLSFVSVWLIKDNVTVAGKLLAKAVETSIAHYNFGVIPLFVVMGLLVSSSGMGRDTFDVAAQAFRKMRGGLGMATVSANAVFAAVNGSTIASASVFTKLAVPELMRLGYSPRFSVGIVAGSSILGMLIPPSLLLIIFGIIAEVSIGHLFTAGIVPGLILAVALCLTIYILIRLAPGFAMAREGIAVEPSEIMGVATMMVKIFPIVLLIFVVLGGIYLGVFTPVEAGGVGALAALVIAVAKRRLTFRSFWQVLVETGYVTASISFLIIAAHLYARMLAISGLPTFMGEWLDTSGFGFTGIMISYLIAIILLGTIIDAASIILIMVPLAVPVMMGLDVNLVWFGIVTIIAVEIGLLTPPLGLACYVIKTNLEDQGITLNDIFYGAAPFALTMLVVLALVVAVPELSLFLVDLLN